MTEFILFLWTIILGLWSFIHVTAGSRRVRKFRDEHPTHFMSRVYLFLLEDIYSIPLGHFGPNEDMEDVSSRSVIKDARMISIFPTTGLVGSLVYKPGFGILYFFCFFGSGILAISVLSSLVNNLSSATYLETFALAATVLVFFYVFFLMPTYLHSTINGFLKNSVVIFNDEVIILLSGARAESCRVDDATHFEAYGTSKAQSFLDLFKPKAVGVKVSTRDKTISIFEAPASVFNRHAKIDPFKTAAYLNQELVKVTTNPILEKLTCGK